MNQECGYYFQSYAFQKFNRFLLCGDNQIFIYKLNKIQVEIFTSDLSGVCGIGYENNSPPCWSLKSSYDPLLFINFVGVYNIKTNVLVNVIDFSFGTLLESFGSLEFEDRLLVLDLTGIYFFRFTFFFKANNTLSVKTINNPTLGITVVHAL